MKPNFLFIGPSKAGSSWLYWMLAQHPQVFVPKAKDIYFFDKYFGRGMDWYLDQFKNAPNSCFAAGEISHDYLYSVEAANRIHDSFPDMKLLTFLRNPVQRSFSHYLFLHRSGMTQAPFREALRDHPDIVDHSLYGKHLAPYLGLFPADQIGIFNFHDLNADKNLAPRVCRFLGVDAPDFETTRKILGAAKPRNYLLAKTIKAGARAFRAMRLEKIVGTVKSHPLVTHALYKEYQEHDKPRLGEDDQQFLTSQFQEDLGRLAEYMQVAKFPNPDWVKDLIKEP